MTRAKNKQPALLSLISLAFLAVLTACNPSATESGSDTGTDTDSTGGDNTSGGGSAEEQSASTVVLGIGTGQLNTFSSGELLVGDGSGNDLSANGELSVEVRLVDTNDGNSLVVGSTYTVHFGSICAEREPAAAVFQPATVEVRNGIARTRYVDRGCGNVMGSSPDQLYAVVEDHSVSASGSIRVLASDVGRIEVDSISDRAISYREGVVLGGQKLPLQSEITFRVVDEQGNPVSNRDVTFRPDSTVGGVFVKPTSGVTDDHGTVRTYLYAGRVNSAVGVTGTHVTEDNVEFETTSPAIAMHTGYPTQRGFNLLVDTFNPNAFRYGDVPVVITATLADRYGNFGPETEIVFSSKRGGRIEGSCTTTEDGNCAVTWLSAPGSIPDAATKEEAHVYVTALTEGEGDFKDLDGDGLFDPDADGAIDQGSGTRSCAISQEDGANNGFCSYPEAHFETSGNNAFDAGTEEFSDWDADGSRDSQPGVYQGVRCTANAIAQGHCANTLQLREYTGIVLSSDDTPTFNNPSYGTFDLGDSNGNILPLGSTVTGACAKGEFKTGTWLSPIPNAFWTELIGYTYSTHPSNDGEISECKVTVSIDDGMRYSFPVINLASALRPIFTHSVTGEFSLTDQDGTSIPVGSTVMGECEKGDFVNGAGWASPVFAASGTEYTYTTSPDDDGNLSSCSITVTIEDINYRYPVRLNP